MVPVAWLYLLSSYAFLAACEPRVASAWGSAVAVVEVSEGLGVWGFWVQGYRVEGFGFRVYRCRAEDGLGWGVEVPQF